MGGQRFIKAGILRPLCIAWSIQHNKKTPGILTKANNYLYRNKILLEKNLVKQVLKKNKLLEFKTNYIKIRKNITLAVKYL